MATTTTTWPAIPAGRCRMGRVDGVVLGVLVGLMAMLSARAQTVPVTLRDHDLVAFVGGGSWVAMEKDGSVETLLTLAHLGRQVRFRSLAWEGDTAAARPRELNFPTLTQQLAELGITVVFAQWGVAESTAGERGRAAFRAAVESSVAEIQRQVPRVVLVTPPPFESKPPPLPDATAANSALAQYAAELREVAAAKGCGLVDLQEVFSQRVSPEPLTHDGRERTPYGHQRLAAAWVRALGRADWAEAAERPGFWTRPDVIRVREAVRAKNRLWFDSWRPMNWAFLNGDRTEQLFSRDPVDPKVRRFLAEMEGYGPLLKEAETRVQSAVAQGEWGGWR